MVYHLSSLLIRGGASKKGYIGNYFFFSDEQIFNH